MQWLGILLTAALLAAMPGYGSAQPAKEKVASPATAPKILEEAGPAAPAAKGYTAQDRQAYQKKVAADLDKLQQQLNDFNNKALTTASQKRTKMRIVVGLQKQVFVARNQLAALEKAGEKDWSGLKANMDKALKGLTKNLDEAEAALQ